MTVTLSGLNAFALRAELSRRVSQFVAEYGDLALERLDGEEASLERLTEALVSLPFLATKKMVVIRSGAANKQFSEKFEQIFAQIPETTEVILIEPKLDKRSVYYKFLHKNTDFRDFPEVEGNGLVGWLTKRASEAGGNLVLANARYLVERAGTNQQNLSNELDKLLLYNPKISRQTIDLLVEPTPQSTVFQLLEAAFGGKTKQTLTLYEEQRALKVEPAQIIAMLTWQLHVLAVIKTAGERGTDEIARHAKLSPFVVGKSLAIARQLSLGALKGHLHNLLQLDIRSKQESIDLDEALQYYLLELATT